MCRANGTSSYLKINSRPEGRSLRKGLNMRREGGGEGPGSAGLRVWSFTGYPASYLTQQLEKGEKLCFSPALIPLGSGAPWRWVGLEGGIWGSARQFWVPAGLLLL